jgi:cytoskeletal protein RodZ
MASAPEARPTVTERLRARRDRIIRIRKHTFAAAGTTFALAWGVIFVQLVSGHDPVLAKQSTAGSSASHTTVTTSASGSTAASSAGSTSYGGSASTGSSSTSPVTTSQS